LGQTLPQQDVLGSLFSKTDLLFYVSASLWSIASSISSSSGGIEMTPEKDSNSRQQTSIGGQNMGTIELCNGFSSEEEEDENNSSNLLVIDEKVKQVATVMPYSASLEETIDDDNNEAITIMLDEEGINSPLGSASEDPLAGETGIRGGARRVL
jgi:hypothetical protein